MVTKRPVKGSMVDRGAQALYDQHREIEGRVPWDDAAPWVKETWLQKVRLVLEAVLPQDAEFLREFADECRAVAEIL